MFKNLTSTITGIFLLLSILNIVSRALGFFREIIFAYFFGTQKDFDIYLVASVIPTTISTIILYIGQNYFIPAYNSSKKTHEKSLIFFKSNINIFALLGSILTILFFIFSDMLLKIFIVEPDLKLFTLASSVFKILIVVLPLNAVISILIAYYQAEMEFIIPAISRLFLNITIIPIVIFSSQNLGIYSIAVGLSIGVIIQFLFLFLKLKIKDKWQIRTYFYRPNNLTQNFTSVMIGIFIVESVSQFYTILDRFFYTYVDTGGIASLNYAFNIFMIPISIISISIATLIFSKISEYFGGNSKIDLNNYVSEFLKINFIIFLLISFIIFLYGQTIIKLLLERGEFIQSDTKSTFSLLKIYTIGLLFYSTYSLYNKILYSAKLVWYLVLVTLIGLLIKVGLNFALVDYYKQSGLAIATSFSHIAMFFVANYLIKFKLNIRSNENYLFVFVFYVINFGISYLIASAVTDLIKVPDLISIINQMLFFIILCILNLILLNDSILKYFVRIKSSIRIA